jgi:hypothetical protein
MQFVTVCQSFDGGNLSAIGVRRHGDTGINRLAVIDNRASAALARVAAKLRAFEFQRIAQKFQ